VSLTQAAGVTCFQLGARPSLPALKYMTCSMRHEIEMYPSFSNNTEGFLPFRKPLGDTLNVRRGVAMTTEWNISSAWEHILHVSLLNTLRRHQVELLRKCALVDRS
jgi:hypothetical protein